jgi:predicted nucleic acid-binding protein
MAADRTLIDTTVLVAVVDPARDGHRAATALLDDGRPLAITPQILREFMVVASRPRSVNGLGLALAQVALNAEEFAESALMLAEDYRVARVLRLLVGQRRAAGKQIHDANIVACALVHGVRRIVTGNPRHFDRFDDLIEIVPLA